MFETILNILFLFIGIAVLVKFSSITINRAARLSQLSGISQMAIGFIFIAVITSLPELSIGVISALEGVSLLSIGNVIGANITNLTLVFGLTAFIGFNLGKLFTPQIERGVFITSIIAAFLIVLGAANVTFGIFCILLFYMFVSRLMKDGFVPPAERPFVKTWSMIVAAAQLIGAVIVVIISAYVITNSSVAIAGFFGVSEVIIGATVLAFGTTLPELSINLTAVRKRNISLAIGDIVGSIVTNLTLILGLVAILNPFTLETGIYTVLLMLIAINALFFFMAKRMNFGLKQGIILVSVYIVYLAILFLGVGI